MSVLVTLIIINLLTLIETFIAEIVVLGILGIESGLINFKIIYFIILISNIFFHVDLKV